MGRPVRSPPGHHLKKRQDWLERRRRPLSKAEHRHGVVRAPDRVSGVDDRICRGCSRPYDPTTRGSAGPFHFYIVRLERTPDGMVRLVGHWRAGLWKDGTALHLLVGDGSRRVRGATMESPISAEAEMRGQRSLVVDPREVTDVLADTCLWQD
jgi:hypothetical protein